MDRTGEGVFEAGADSATRLGGVRRNRAAGAGEVHADVGVGVTAGDVEQGVEHHVVPLGRSRRSRLQPERSVSQK